MNIKHLFMMFWWGVINVVLAAWFRLKYPHIAIGAVASSAPILQFENITSPYAFNNIITQDFKVSHFLSLFTLLL